MPHHSPSTLAAEISSELKSLYIYMQVFPNEREIERDRGGEREREREREGGEVHQFFFAQNGNCTQISLFRALYFLSYLGFVKLWCIGNFCRMECRKIWGANFENIEEI